MSLLEQRATPPLKKNMSWLFTGGDSTKNKIHSQSLSRSDLYEPNNQSMAMQQKPIEKGGTDSIYKAYFLGLCTGIFPQNMALYGTVPPF